MKRWTLSQDAFDGFLTVLDPDRDAAGREYQALRVRIVKFFEWRSAIDPEVLADETFDRLIRKLADGEEIRDVPRYLYGVAKLVFLESLKTKRREEPIEADLPASSPDTTEDIYLSCLESCLREISAASRSLILRYYRFDRQAKIDDRKLMADALGLTPNALRIKALRVRSKVETCVRKCVLGE